jgi:hypothetical protein
VADLQSGLNRREFLQAAALGALAVPAYAGPGRAINFARQVGAQKPLPARSSLLDAVDTYQGVVEAVTAASLEVQVNSAIRSIHLNKNTQFWNGGWNGRSPRAGDVALVRSVIPGQAQYVWSNLVAIQGTVVGTSGKSATLIRVSGPGIYAGQTIAVDTRGVTQWQSVAPSATLPIPGLLPTGFAANVTGLDVGGEIVATMVGYADPSVSQTVVAPSAPQIIAGPDGSGICYMRWTGHCTWFSCPDGVGTCGTCNTGDNNQAAWPWIYGRCNCVQGCTTQCALECGNSFYFFPCAGTSSVQLTVVDTGPSLEAGCSGGCGATLCSYTCTGEPCGLNKPVPIVDLTMPTFARWYSPSEYGCFSCAAELACECAGCSCPY